MILVDANLLIYSHVASLPQHEAAREWLDEKLNGTVRLGLAWPCLLAFVRLVSNPRVFEHPEAIGSAWTQVERWLDCDPVWIPHATDRHRDILGGLLKHAGARANLVPDAHLAALAIEHGLTLCTTDGDFTRFKDLKCLNPLSKEGG